MKNLFIDTASARIIVALTTDNQILSIRNEENNHELSTRIFPIIDSVLSEARVTPHDIDAIYIVVGPGSFTGVRIGVTIAKTMAWSLKKKIIPISELELMATTSFDGNFIATFIDARRNSSFAGIYDKNGNSVLKDQYITNDALLNIASNYDNIVFSGYDNVEKFNYIIPEVDILKIINRHQNDKLKNPHEINPQYLKKTEAEENLDKGRL